MAKSKKSLTSNHWGLGLLETNNGHLVDVLPHPGDPNPSPINGNIADSICGDARVRRPSFRRGWLENGPGDAGGKRGREEFVELDWDDALDRIAAEISRVRSNYGNETVFAGSYGWSSAGRFNHAQSQLKRFLNTQGGFVRSEGNYSYNAALVLMPYIVGDFRRTIVDATRWSVVSEHSDLVVCFGGVAARNGQVSDGGISKHRLQDNLVSCAQNGVKFINISPLRTDLLNSTDAEWLPANPGSDTALMMGIAHTLISEGLQDDVFLKRYTVGYGKVRHYLLGYIDGQPKDADWAASQSGISAKRIKSLAHEMVSSRTMISTAAGVQRADYGEQPLWMTITLAALIGQIGLPGGGYTIGYGVNGNVGNMERLIRAGTLEQGSNPIETFIPVAMISDMLLNPGTSYRYNGSTYSFPNIKMVWWAGGNPFHHHQDLNRLATAFQKPETIIVNEINWTSTARHADIVLPVASSIERNDFGAGRSDNALIPMPAAIAPVAEARTEYDFLADLAKRMGSHKQFTYERSEGDWLEEIWSTTKKRAKDAGFDLPIWKDFLQGDAIYFPDPSPNQVFLADFRDDPNKNPLKTPSGKIELFSEVIASFELEDCPGHATWFAPRDLANGLKENYPLYLLSGQPGTRLHSQYDNGRYSKSLKIADREPVIIHPEDAKRYGIFNGDIVELSNQRGACLAGARVSDEIREGCVFLWTGAWYDPDYSVPNNRDRHGNPNVLTHDQKTSDLSQSPAAHSALIKIRKYTGDIPHITVHAQPKFK